MSAPGASEAGSGAPRSLQAGTPGAPRFVLIAGEASGDILGAAILRGLRARYPQAQFSGVSGPRMREAGCDSLASIDALSVMGIAEVLPKLPSILRLRRGLRETLIAQRPDVVIGIDAPDFNLPLERRLREAGLRTVHVVSPSVWAWRPGRVKGIVAAVDLLLCLLPFEPAFYAAHAGRKDFRAEFIGHPLAEELADPPSRAAARAQLGLAADGEVVAVLPGSRGGELKFLAEPFAAAAAWLAARRPGLRFVVPIAKPSLRPLFEAAIAKHAPGLSWQLVDGHSREVMRAADVVLIASGTATLECALLQRPMVVGYRVAALSAAIVRALKLMKIDRYSLPNLLGERDLVPELIQEDAQPDKLGAALLQLLEDESARTRQLQGFDAIRTQLRQDGAARAATAIAALLESPS